MNHSEPSGGHADVVRIVILAVAGVVGVNWLGAILFDRDTGLGPDDLLYVLAGLGLAAIVEFGYRSTRK